MGIILFDLHFGHTHPIKSLQSKKHPDLSRMPIKSTLYEYGIVPCLQCFTSQNGYKTTKLYYITQPVILPVKKHPSILISPMSSRQVKNLK